jgi:hypothetical protein
MVQVVESLSSNSEALNSLPSIPPQKEEYHFSIFIKNTDFLPEEKKWDYIWHKDSISYKFGILALG